ncbi:COMM domain-containing protein 6 [Hyperolius riggenbachi]|uniref:COMM domain-containing protein 6 n=1 Tax=Hyperolius riggenbachi TaxID=752182 RepID=UPI0035A2CB12
MLERELSGAGFETSSDLIKSLPADLFAELCQQIVAHLRCQSGGVDQTHFCQRFQATGVEASTDDIRSVISAVTRLFSTAAKHKLSSDALVNFVLSKYKLPKQILQAIRHVWNEEGKRLLDAEISRDVLSASQLVDFQWKIGMAVSSDSCRSLNHPYITVSLKVADSSGQVISKVFEMSISEFQNFHRQFKEMSAALESV